MTRWAALPVVRGLLARRRAAQRDQQLPELLERVASSLRAGRSLGAALVEVGAAAPLPLGPELDELVRALRHGAPLVAAVAVWQEHAAPSREVDLAATALALGASTGGEVARALDRVAATLRERRELRAEVRALATQARASAAVLVGAPLAFAGLVSAVEPGVAAFLLASPLGLACLAAGLSLDAAGALWMARIVEDAG